MFTKLHVLTLRFAEEGKEPNGTEAVLETAWCRGRLDRCDGETVRP